MADLRKGLAGALVGLAMAGAAHAAEAPPFKLIRSDEDYGYLAKVPDKTGLDALRYIPIGDAGYMSLGGEARLRVDSIDAPRFGLGGEQADTLVAETHRTDITELIGGF